MPVNASVRTSVATALRFPSALAAATPASDTLSAVSETADSVPTAAFALTTSQRDVKRVADNLACQSANRTRGRKSSQRYGGICRNGRAQITDRAARSYAG